MNDPLEPIRQLNKTLKLLQQIKKINEILKIARPPQEKQMVLREWLQEHSSSINEIAPEQLEELREAAEYDRDEWVSLMRQLQKPKD